MLAVAEKLDRPRRARHYNPKVGRWLSQDPIGFTSGDANFYRYLTNSPTNSTDAIGWGDVEIIENGDRSSPTYGAVLIHHSDDGTVTVVSGSSFPNPTNASPGVESGTYTYRYSDTGHHQTDPALQLNNNGQVPTRGPNPNQNNQSFADFIHVHEGDSARNRGSAGCPTVQPSDSSRFFSSFSEGETGRITVIRTSNFAPPGAR